jgi:hypothetical protein
LDHFYLDVSTRNQNRLQTYTTFVLFYLIFTKHLYICIHLNFNFDALNVEEYLVEEKMLRRNLFHNVLLQSRRHISHAPISRLHQTKTSSEPIPSMLNLIRTIRTKIFIDFVYILAHLSWVYLSFKLHLEIFKNIN